MRLSLFAAAAALCVSCLAAHADTLLTYDLNATYANGASVKGTATFDSTSASFTAADLTASGFPYGSGSGYTGVVNFPNVLSVSNSTLSTAVNIFFGTYLGPGYDASAIPVIGVYFNGGNSADDFHTTSATFTQAPATPVSATPEPSSIALLGTGLLGLAATLRKRLS